MTHFMLSRAAVAAFFCFISTVALHGQAPAISSTKVDALSTDTDNDTKADPLDVIQYTIGISNTGTASATGTTFTDPTPTNTTLIGTSVNVSPVAIDDAYPLTVLPNIGINTNSSSEFSVVTNDFKGFVGGNAVAVGDAALTITSVGAATGGGTVVMTTSGADIGKFSYTPAPGFTGTDTFTYTISNTAGGDALSRTATVSITVAGNVIWFVNSTGAAGDGRLATPFNSLSAFQAVNDGVGTAHPAANHFIFLFENGTSYTGPVTLLNNQKLIGQDATASLATIAGVTPSVDSTTLPVTNSANGTFVTLTSASNAVNLGSGNTVRGLTVGNTSGTDIIGTAVGSLAVSDVTLSGTGQAFVVSTSGALAVTINSLSSSSGTNGVNLTGCSGTFTASAGAINGPTGDDFVVNGGTVTVNSAATITNTAGRSVNIVNKTASGNVSFTGAISDTGTGILLDNNDGATVSFTGGLNLNTAANTAFAATNGGTVTATQNNTSIVNSLTSTTATALVVTNTNIGAAGLTFRSISANGATNGILLNTTGTSGRLSVTGTGAVNTGGTITNTAGVGVSLNSTVNVSLNHMLISNTGHNGISGLNLTDPNSGDSIPSFELRNSRLTNAGDADGESALNFGGPAAPAGNTGRIVVADTIIEQFEDFALTVGSSSGALTVDVLGTRSGTSPNFDSTMKFDDNNDTHGESAILITTQGTAVVNLNVNGAYFNNVEGSGVLFQPDVPAATNDLNVIGCAFNNAGGPDNFPNPAYVVISSRDQNTVTFDVQGNDMLDCREGVVVVGDGNLMGRIGGSNPSLGNRITGVAFDAIRLDMDGVFGNTINSANFTWTVLVQNNVLTGAAGNTNLDDAIQVLNRDHVGTLNLTIENNTISDFSSEALRYFSGERGSPVLGDTTGVVRFANNTLSNTAFGAGEIDIYLRSTDQALVSFDITGNTNSSGAFTIDFDESETSTQNVEQTSLANVSSLNGGATVTNSVGAVTFNVPITPPLPSNPLLFAPDLVTTSGLPAPSSATEAIAWTEMVRERSLPTPTAGFDPIRQTPTPSQIASPATVLTQTQLDSLVSAARARWEATGLSEAQLAALDKVTFEVADLPGWYLGEAAGKTVRVDSDAGGNGWFIDSTPMEDGEFGENQKSEIRNQKSDIRHSAPGGVDLLTTILHEMGHAIGLCDTYSKLQRSSVMYGFLNKGERRLPKRGEGNNAVPHEHMTPHFLSTPISIGTLPVGKSVTITYQTTVNGSLPLGTFNISNQGTVTADGGISVLTDDTAVGGTADPTLTPVDRPDTTVSSISLVGINPTNATTVSWTVTFANPIINLATSHFALANGGLTGPSVGTVTAVGGTTPNAQWTVTANTGSGNGSLGLNMVNDTVPLSHDVTNLTFTGQVYTIDKIAPTVVMSSAAANPTNSSPILVTAQFSETVLNFVSTDIVPGNATVSNFVAVDGDTYTFDLTPTGQGTVTADIAAGVANDAATNGNTVATQFSRTFDSVQPTVAMSSATGDPTTNAPIPVTVQFSEPVVNFILSEIVVSNGTSGSFVAVDGDTYTFNLIPTGPGLTVTANIAAGVANDAALNGNTVATQFSRSIQGPPTVTTPTVTNVTANSATLGGNVTADNGATITARGVVFSKTADDATPQIGELNVNNLTTGGTTGVFTVSATGLSLNTGYSFAAYATNSQGTTYTSPFSTFTTPNVTFALGVTSIVEGPAAGSDTVQLSVTPETGTWTAAVAPADTWLTLAAGSDSGTGSKTVQFNFTANAGATRTGTITIAGLTFTVIQAGAPYVAANPVTNLVTAGIAELNFVTTDSAGNVYFSDRGNNLIKKWTRATNTVSTVDFSATPFPPGGATGVAVDAAGNVYAADYVSHSIKKWTAPAGPATIVVSTGLLNPFGLALDAAGDLLICDRGNNAIKKFTVSSSTVSTVVSSGLTNPDGIAVDVSGNIYIAEGGSSSVKKWTAATSTLSTLISSGLSGVHAVAVDGSGHLYIADRNNSAIKKRNAITGTVTTLVSSGLTGPQGVAVDATGNVYIASSDLPNRGIQQLVRAFVDPTTESVPATLGSDALAPVLPTSVNLLAPFAPTDNQPWLTIGTIAAGVVNYDFTANPTASARSGALTVLGQSVTVNQAGVPATLNIARINHGAEAASPTNGLFRITQTATSATDTVVNYTVTGTATPGSDYTTLSGTATIPANSTTVDINVAVLNDSVLELTETVIVTLSSLGAHDPNITIGGTNSASLDITDNETATLAIAATPTVLEQAAQNVAVTLTIVGDAGGTATLGTPLSADVVDLGTGTATSATDYSAFGTQTVTFTASSISGATQNVVLGVTPDSTVEPNETVKLKLQNLSTTLGGRVSLGTVDSTVTITDDDTSVITLAAVSADKNEGTGGATTSFTFSATLSNPVQGGFSLAYTTNDGTAFAASDYTDNDGPAFAFTGTASESKTITVLVNHDATNEIDEIFSVALGAISGLASGINPANVTTSGSPQTGTIRNDDAVNVSITATDASADENSAGIGTWRITRNGTVGNTVVQLAIDSGSTASAADWTQTGAAFASRTPSSTGTATITGGNTFVDITLTPTADIQAEADETVRLNITADAAYTIGSPSNATVTIGQNDFVVTNTNDAGEGSLRQAILNANAIAGTDSITFDPTVFASVQTISLTTALPNVSTPVTITGPGANLLTVRPAAPGTFSVFVVDAAVSVGLSGLTASNGSFGIGNTNGIVTATSCIFRDGGMGIDNTLGNVTATSCTFTGNQGRGITSFGGTLTITNCTIGGNLQDGLVNNGGILSATNCTISGNTLRGIGNNFTGTGTVTNCTVSGNGTTGIDNVSGTLTLKNTLCVGNTTNATATTDGGGNLTSGTAAAAGLDPAGLQDNGGPTKTIALISGTAAIDAGVNANIPGGITTDQRGGTFSRTIGNVDIGAFEVQKSVSIVADAASAKEGSPSGNTAFTFTVSRLGDTTGSVTMNYAVTGSGANPADATDFGGTLPTGTVTIDATFASKTLTVNVSKDTTVEQDEGFTVTLTNPTNGYILTTSTASSTITNDDSSTALASNLNPSTVGDNVTFTATVSGGSLIPTGTVQFFDGAASLGSVPLTAGSAQLSTTTLTPGTHSITAVYNGDANLGISNSTAVSQYVGTVNPTPTMPPTPPGGFPFSYQTGMFDITVPVQNTTAFAINGFRLNVDFGAYLAAHPSLRLYNATNAPGNNPAYVDYPYPVAVGQTIPVHLIFYTNNLQFPNPFAPTLSVEIFQEPPGGHPAPAGGVPITDIRVLPDNTKLLEWSSIATRWYRINYSSDMITWFDCPVPIQAGSNRQQWIDNGAPFTPISSADPSVTSRFYIVEEIPPPP